VIRLDLPDDVAAQIVEAAAERAAEIVLAQIQQPASQYLTVVEAAELLRCRRQRVDDLLSAGRLRRFKDGSRTLIERREVLAYLAGDRAAPLLPSRSQSRSQTGIAT
jgi:excisionase family DNA binding protein